MTNDNRHVLVRTCATLAALAERPTIDAEVRPWTVHELMIDVLRYIEDAQVRAVDDTERTGDPKVAAELP